jgi:hypothetical protein
MAKFYGPIGFAELVETAPGVWTEQIVEHNYYVDIPKNSRSLQTSAQVNDNVNISNQFSILADPYASQNFHAMRYIEFMGTKWKITNVDVQYPRLVMSAGGIYNGN